MKNVQRNLSGNPSLKFVVRNGIKRRWIRRKRKARTSPFPKRIIITAALGLEKNRGCYGFCMVDWPSNC